MYTQKPSSVEDDFFIKYLFKHYSTKIDPGGLSNIIEYCLWSLDNQDQLIDSLRTVLYEGDSERSIITLLLMEEITVFKDLEEVNHLRAIHEAKWPGISQYYDIHLGKFFQK